MVWPSIKIFINTTSPFDRFCILLVADQGLSVDTSVSSIKKTDLTDITAILLKVSLITYNPNPRLYISMLLSVIKPFPDDIKELYDMKLSPGHIVGFSNECSSASKRLTLMKVGKHRFCISSI